MSCGAYALGSAFEAGKGAGTAVLVAYRPMLVSASLSARAQFDAIDANTDKSRDRGNTPSIMSAEPRPATAC
jgi:hypothetical protein